MNKAKIQFQIDEVEVKEQGMLKGLRFEMELEVSEGYLKAYVESLPKIAEAVAKLFMADPVAASVPKGPFPVC